MALVRVYCGLASADEAVRPASAAPLTMAVVDDAGRLLGVHEISDDPAGYAALGSLLVERTSGFTDAEVAADSDDHVVTSLLIAAGRPLVVTDDDSADDFAERFADDDSPEELQAPPAARRAVGLARALQAGAITAATLGTPRELISYKPILAAHAALLAGRHAAATALRDVLRELYPAALRAFADPAHPLALAVLGELPEPGLLTRHGDDSARFAENVAGKLTSRRAGTEDEVIAAVTALHVAISESPRRGGINKSLAETAADAVRHAVAAVGAANAACAVLIGKLDTRSMGDLGRRGAAALPGGDAARDDRFGRPVRLEPETTGTGPITPRPMTSPPVAPQPVMPPPLAPRPVTPPPAAPAAAAAFPSRMPAPGNRPVSVPPPPPGMKPISSDTPPPPGMAPITPGTRPVPSTRTPLRPGVRPSPASAQTSGSPVSGFPAASSPVSGFPASGSPAPGFSAAGSPVSGFPASGSPLGADPSFGTSSPLAGGPAPVTPAASVSPADSGQPFRATLTNAEINKARAERQRTVIPPRPAAARPDTLRPDALQPDTARTDTAPVARPAGPTDFSLPMPAPRPGTPEPGSRANWPLVNKADDSASAAASVSSPPAENHLNSEGRIRPPWQDMPKEPPALRLVEPQLDRLDRPAPAVPPSPEPPPLRVIDGDGGNRTRRPASPAPAGSTTGSTLTALDRSIAPPVPEGNDGDLLIFAAARSAWFTGHSEDEPAPSLDWTNPNDMGWRAAEKAAQPQVAAETSAGLPKRVPKANLVPGSPLREERPLRIVRDAASIAAHTTGYFRGWRRGQEIGGFAMGGRPGREAAGGWDFTRDGQATDDYRDSAGYGSR